MVNWPSASTFAPPKGASATESASTSSPSPATGSAPSRTSTQVFSHGSGFRDRFIAKGRFERAIQLQPDYAPAQYHLGVLYWIEENPNEAIPLLAAALHEVERA